MTDTTEAVERLTAKLRAAGAGLCTEDPSMYFARGLSVKDATDAADTIQALLERVERAEAGNLHPLAEKVWQQSCQGWMDRAQAAETKLATLTEALEEIEDWSHAYPIAAFPEPDFTKARAALEAAGMTLDAVSASNMRHVVNRVAAMARKARAALSQTQEGKTNG